MYDVRFLFEAFWVPLVVAVYCPSEAIVDSLMIGWMSIPASAAELCLTIRLDIAVQGGCSGISLLQIV